MRPSQTPALEEELKEEETRPGIAGVPAGSGSHACVLRTSYHPQKGGQGSHADPHSCWGGWSSGVGHKEDPEGTTEQWGQAPALRQGWTGAGQPGVLPWSRSSQSPGPLSKSLLEKRMNRTFPKSYKMKKFHR